MRLSSYKLVILACCSAATADFVNPAYPPPRDLSSKDSLVAAAWKNLTDTFDTFYTDPKANASAAAVLAGTENVTFGFGMFSLLDSGAAALQYHYTAPDVAAAPNGTNKVDGDSIYKIASVSKLITTFAGQLKLSNEDWNRPVSEILTELNTNNRSDVIYDLQWDQITPWSFATHLSGIPPLGLVIGDLLYKDAISPPAQKINLGLPPLNPDILGPCVNSSDDFCSDGDFLTGERTQPPIFEAWTSPSYSDAPFFLLGMIIQKLVGTPIAQIYNESIFEPLNMTSSSASIPFGEIDHAPIADWTLWSLDGKLTIPSGGIWSSVNDLAKFGVGILNSTLLSPDRTRKWMKPVSHTASLTYSIGAPWEVIRYIHPTGKVTEIYGKLGDSGPFGGYIGIIPDYNAGFVMGNTAAEAFTERSPLAMTLLDQVAQNIIPALDAQAAEEAKKNFVGTYASTDENLNSSVTISFNESTVPGASDSLSLSSWISNGTDVLAAIIGSLGTPKPRLLPTKIDLKGGRIAFYATAFNQSNMYLGSPFAQGPYSGFYSSNFDFAATGQELWGGRLLNEMVFGIDKDGKALFVTPSAARAKLVRR